MGWTQVRQSKCMGITFPISLSYEHVDIKGRQCPLVQQFPMDLRGQNHGKLTTKKQKDISKVVKNRIRLHSSNVRDYHVLSSIGCSLEPETVGLGNESCNQVPPPPNQGFLGSIIDHVGPKSRNMLDTPCQNLRNKQILGVGGGIKMTTLEGNMGPFGNKPHQSRNRFHTTGHVEVVAHGGDVASPPKGRWVVS